MRAFENDAYTAGASMKSQHSHIYIGRSDAMMRGLYYICLNSHMKE